MKIGREHTRITAKAAGMICLLCLAALYGCSFGMAGGATQVIPENECRTDSDCSSGDSVCDADRSICVSRLSSEKNLLVEIVPKNPSGSPLPSQYFVYEGETNRAVEAPFTLRDTISISGWVKWGEDPDGYQDLCTSGENIDDGGLCIVDAKIELIPAGEFPESERQTVSVTTSNTEQVRADPSEVAFEITAVPGVYSLRVVPEPPFDTFLPPVMVYEAKYMDASENLSYRYDRLDTMGRVDGIVRDAVGDPLSNISVWAVDPVTGKRISSIAAVDSELKAMPGGFQAGEAVDSMFRLYMDPQWLEGAFMIHISSDEEAPTIPSIKFGPFSFPEMDGLLSDPDDYVNFEDLDMAGYAGYSLMLPAIGVRVEYQASVEGVNEDGTFGPIEGVKVKFLTEEIGDGSVSGSYEISGSTNIDGLICGTDPETCSVWLLEGFYSVTLYPPLQSDYEAARITDIPISAYPDEPSMPIAGQVFQLQAKRSVIGQILTQAAGEPAGAMTLEAYPLSSGGTSDSGVIARFNSTQSDDEGMFELVLDRGTYDLLLMPDPGSNFPWLWKESVSVTEGEGAVALSVELPDPAAFRASAFDADGEPLVGAEVKVYEIGDSFPGEPVPTRQIARTTTRSDGTFLCLIAPNGGPVID